MASKQKVLFAVVAGGSAASLLLPIVFWVYLLLSDGPAFIPNYAERLAMFKALRRGPGRGKPWTPRQGDNWIF